MFTGYKFTGKERDTETGLDYFGARYNASTMGRFMSPDPVAGEAASPQSLNLYSYVRNNPLKFIDPTGMIVEWHDTKCKKGQSTCPSKAQQAYEARLKQLRESKNAKERARGERLSAVYKRLQDSKAIFEVKNSGGNEPSHGDIHYDGNDHFTIDLKGDTAYHLSDNQRLAHEFEHGRQVLDGELSFHNYTPGKWLPFALDRTDESNGFAAGFDIEPASPGQGSFINDVQRSINSGGVAGGATRLGAGDSPYRSLPQGPVNVEHQSPAIYRVPQ
jgi:RHS repeat-associated protein